MGRHIGSQSLAHNAPFSHLLLFGWLGEDIAAQSLLGCELRLTALWNVLFPTTSLPLFPPPSLHWTAGENLTMRDDNKMPKHGGEQMSCEREQSREFARWCQAPGRVSPPEQKKCPH